MSDNVISANNVTGRKIHQNLLWISICCLQCRLRCLVFKCDWWSDIKDLNSTSVENRRNMYEKRFYSRLPFVCNYQFVSFHFWFFILRFYWVGYVFIIMTVGFGRQVASQTASFNWNYYFYGHYFGSFLHEIITVIIRRPILIGTCVKRRR